MANKFTVLKAVFDLKFRLDDSNVVHLDITWKETGETHTIPPEHWPFDTEDLKSVQRTMFPRWDSRLKAAKIREKTRKIELKRKLRELDPLEQKVRVTSRTSGKTYIITSIDNGKKRKIQCTCPDYIFRRKKTGAHCKHISVWLKNIKQKKKKTSTVLDESFKTVRGLLDKIK